MVAILPHLNAALNLLATLLLVVGGLLIKRGRVVAHRNVMLLCFGVSCLFLVSYLTYHHFVGHVSFPKDAPTAVRYFYLTVLLTHVVLAALVPILAIVTIILGLRDVRVKHRAWARWTFPVWLYVSITGVIVYVMLYHLYAAEGVAATIR
ncbi:MAG: DUF420 domain-containing protein [Pirellulaceae bacterium]|nr:DUF420 domain-containing protein [Planctomycetales bacterium]